MPSPFKVIAEDSRQELAQDDKFYKSFLYFFELQASSESVKELAGFGAGSISQFFPLILNPEGITMSEPYSVEATPTTEGGLFVEENGIIQRTLTITGTTGFVPRPNHASAGLSDSITTSRPSFVKRGVANVAVALSGQRHFQFLQDRVFRAYGDLKRDPSTAKDTKLIFHNVKDDEHWLVIPREFRLDRDVRRRFLYRYTIILTVVDVAHAADLWLKSEDKGLLDTIKDGLRTAQSYVNMAIGAVNDVRSVIRDIELTVASIGTTINSVSTFIDSVTDVITGAGDLIARPFKEVSTIVNSLDDSINQLVTAPSVAKDHVVASFRQMTDAFDGFGIHPELFEGPVQKRLTTDRRRQELATSQSRSALESAENNPPNSFQELGKLGTGLMPGDAERARGEFGVGRNEPAYRSAEEREVTQGDTLQSLSAKYLGDARHWRKLATLNNLKPPYISQSGLPGTLRIGSKILIPSLKRPPKEEPLLSVLGVSPTAPLEEQFLGTDLRLNEASGPRGFYDLVVDTEGGSTDFKLVSGVDNLKQAVRTRLTTEQGHDIMYKNVGHRRIVGIGLTAVDAEIARFRLIEAVVADPRIESVSNLKVGTNGDQPDVISVEMDAIVRRLNEQVSVRTSLF